MPTLVLATFLAGGAPAGSGRGSAPFTKPLYTASPAAISTFMESVMTHFIRKAARPSLR